MLIKLIVRAGGGIRETGTCVVVVIKCQYQRRRSVCRSVEISWLIAALYNHLDKNTDRDAYAK